MIYNRKQGHYNDRRICEMMTLNEIHYNLTTSNFFVSSVLRFEKSSYTKHALAYRINWKINIPYAGESGMLLHRKEKLQIAKSKSSRLS
jgi:hypothetical protein